MLDPFLLAPADSDPAGDAQEHSAPLPGGVIRAPFWEEMGQDEGTSQMWDWYTNTRPPTVADLAKELSLLEPGNKHRARFEHWISLWNQAKTRTDSGFQAELVALQMAAAQELGLSLPFLRREQGLPSVRKALDTYGPPMRAFVRALYASTQQQLRDQGIKGAILWRGIKQSTGYPFPYPEGFFLGRLANNPLASFTLSVGQAARFAPGDVGALNCAYVEASRIIGTPFTGLGVLPQKEAISLGEVATREEDRCFWLVWRDGPSGDVARSLGWRDWRDLIEKYATETGDDES